MMKFSVLVLVCLWASAFGMKKVVIKDEKETFGIKNHLMFYKMLFGEKGMDMLMNEMTVEERLMFDLLKVYNKHVNPTGTTRLTFSLSYLCADVNKLTNMMTSRVIEKYTWTDLRLKWDPTDYNNIREIRFPATKIWTPDVKLFNSHIEEEMRDDINVVIKHDGTILWMPQVTYKTNCMTKDKGINTNMNIGTGTGFGIDTERGLFTGDTTTTFKCKLVVGSWSYDDKILKLVDEGLGLDKTNFLETCTHEIKDLNVKVVDHTYPCCPNEKYPAMHLDFTVIKRDI